MAIDSHEIKDQNAMRDCNWLVSVHQAHRQLFSNVIPRVRRVSHPRQCGTRSYLGPEQGMRGAAEQVGGIRTVTLFTTAHANAPEPMKKRPARGPPAIVSMIECFHSRLKTNIRRVRFMLGTCDKDTPLTRPLGFCPTSNIMRLAARWQADRRCWEC